MSPLGPYPLNYAFTYLRFGVDACVNYIFKSEPNHSPFANFLLLLSKTVVAVFSMKALVRKTLSGSSVVGKTSTSELLLSGDLHDKRPVFM